MGARRERATAAGIAREPVQPARARADNDVDMIRRLVVSTLGLLLLGVVPAAGWAGAGATPAYNLGGVWSSPLPVERGGTSLTLKQSGNAMSWKGGPHDRAWIQEFTGTLTGSGFSGEFVQDAPGVNPKRYHGAMTARIIDDCHFVFTSVVQPGMPPERGAVFTKLPCAMDRSTLPVPIASVSNGCGGGNWKSLVKAQNLLGNTSSFADAENLIRHDWPVDFVDACNLHDAGYAGTIVRDKLRGGIKDFRHWTRKQVDEKFLTDMRLLCYRAIPRSAPIALDKCLGHGGHASIGAESRYDFVRSHGARFFDADLGQPGTQRTGPRANS
jgi:hypothetical protein